MIYRKAIQKTNFLRLMLIVGLLVILARLFELQVVKGGYYKNLSEGNRIRRVNIVAPRGLVLARGGETLAGNIEVPKKVIFDSESGYKKVNIPDEEKDINSVIEYKRVYPFGSVASHITGYLGRVSETEQGKIDGGCPEKGVRSNEGLLGRSALEQSYDCLLRGVDGEELIEVESNGKRVRTLGTKNPIEGEDLKTTLDLPLQKFVLDLMEGKIGAAVATDAYGEILALYSSPSFDSGAFVSGNGGLIEKIFGDPNVPLFNRVISGNYAPGSIFKPLVSIAALEENAIDSEWIYEDTGRIQFKTLYGEYTYNNWYFTQYGGTEGRIDLTKAIARSTDTFFYKVGEELGVDKMVDWTRRFGLGKETGIDLPGEAKGLVPDPGWKESTKGERWFLGNTYHMAIGQGDLLVTPIQMNVATSAIANGGKLCKPHLAMGEKNCVDIGIESENIELVREGMVKACSTGGTGFTFFDFEQRYGFSVACKTGTAEVGGDDETHAWFSVFAPVEDPQMVLIVLIEKGGEGSKVAGPIARQIFDFWFKNKLKEEYKVTPTPEAEQ